MADTVFHHDKFKQCNLKDEIKFSKNKHTQKNVKGSNLTYFVHLKVSVHICSLIIIGRETKRLQMI